MKIFILKIIAILMTLTLFRVQTILFIPKIEMFDGIAPNAWLGPWVSPMPEEMASQITVYLGIGVFMIFQLTALALLFRTDVIRHFSKPQLN